MSNDTRFISIPGSNKEPVPNARVVGDPSSDQEFEVFLHRIQVQTVKGFFVIKIFTNGV